MTGGSTERAYLKRGIQTLRETIREGDLIMGFIGDIFTASSERKAEKKQEARQLASIEEQTKLRERLMSEALSGVYQGQFGLEDIFGSRRDEIDLGDSILSAIPSQSRESRSSQFIHLRSQQSSHR